MNYCLVGYGKMGRAVDQVASRRGHRRVAVVEPGPDSPPGSHGSLTEKALHDVEVAFEFTRPAAAAGNVTALLEAGVAVVCGTTGWTLDPETERRARESGPGAVIAPNFSVGMNLFYRLVRDAASLYGALGLHQAFIVESHHRGKLDAPSGTARHLGAILLEVDPSLRRTHEGSPEGRLPDDTLQITSIRAGGEPGTHTVGYDGEYDRVTLTHTARSREGLALGAVLAGEWVLGRHGLHDFEDVLESILASSRQAADDQQGIVEQGGRK